MTDPEIRLPETPDDQSGDKPPRVSAVESSRSATRTLANLSLRDLNRGDVVDSLSRYLIIRLRRHFPGLPEADAEDIASASIAKITRWERPIGNLASLAYTIAIRATFRRSHRNDRSLNEVTDTGVELGDTIAAKDTSNTEDLRMILESAIDGLDPIDRQIIALRASGYTLEEMAEKTKLHISSLNRRLLKTRETLKGLLQD